MRPEKLMIGDWVSLFQGNPDGSSCNVQVSYIGEYGEVGIKGCEEYTSANCNLLFPIPLTPEILVKNGFVQFMSHNWLIVIDNITIELREPQHNMAIWLDWAEHETGTYASYILPSPNCVHELQHTLRLCGINKEIEI